MASTTTPARVRSRRITVSAAATSSGTSARGYFGCRDLDGPLQRRALRRERAPAASEDDRDQAVAGREARARRRAARREGDGRDRRDARRAPGRGLHLAGEAFGVFDADRADPVRRRTCANSPAASRPGSSSRSAIRGSGSASPRRSTRPASRRTSSSSTAGEGGTGAAPLEFVNHVGAPLREALMLVHNTLVGDRRARPHPDRRRGQGHDGVRHRAHRLRSARTGATRRAATCSRSAASSRCRATRIAARPASRRRTRGAGASSTCRTRRRACSTFTRTR